jgi:hypothetical protein
MKLIFMPTVAAVLLILIAVPQVAQAVDTDTDTVPPVPECTALCNAGSFLISATDDVDSDENIQLYINDTGSGTDFGPLPNPEMIKYIQSNRTPIMMPKNGSFFIFGSGPPNITAVDSSGNVGVAVCQPQ